MVQATVKTFLFWSALVAFIAAPSCNNEEAKVTIWGVSASDTDDGIDSVRIAVTSIDLYESEYFTDSEPVSFKTRTSEYLDIYPDSEAFGADSINKTTTYNGVRICVDPDKAHVQLNGNACHLIDCDGDGDCCIYFTTATADPHDDGNPYTKPTEAKAGANDQGGVTIDPVQYDDENRNFVFGHNALAKGEIDCNKFPIYTFSKPVQIEEE